MLKYHGKGKYNIGEDIMYKVPCHIKAHVNRIVREYELLLHQGHKIALQLFRNNRMYSGLETTEYFLKSARHFRNLLDTQGEYLAAATEEEFRRKVYQKICEFYNPLSETAILRITHSTACQEQLERALRAAKKNLSLASDAKFLSWFISNACIQSWCPADESINHKEFKLVKTEEAFEKLLSGQEKYPTIEITQDGNAPYSRFRIALQTIDIEACYRKQSRVREYRNFWDNYHNIEEFDTDYKIFNMWNNITETGIYYVYIPQT